MVERQLDDTFSPPAISTDDNEAVDVVQFRVESFDFVPIGPEHCLPLELEMKAFKHIPNVYASNDIKWS